MPSNLPIEPLKMGEESNYVKPRQRRPKARSRKRATGWKGSPNRSWPPSQTSSIIGSSIREKYLDELPRVDEAYPGIRIWNQDNGIWLLSKSSLLPALNNKVIFLTAIPFDQSKTVRSWAFWNVGAGLIWIGPRHTNFPDGSICAFEPTDRTWSVGDSLITLLDLYTLWALRHLYLDNFKRWPGYQAVHHPYERILELAEDEYCGCNGTERLYKECCQTKDLSIKQIANAINFYINFSGSLRTPPKKVVSFINNPQHPPSFSNL